MQVNMVRRYRLAMTDEREASDGERVVESKTYREDGVREE